MHYHHTASWLALVSLLAVGCGSDPVPPPNTGHDAAGNAAGNAAGDQGKQDGDGEGASNVGVDERIRKMCDLPEARFNFDSSSVSGQAKSVLEAIAKCFVSGPGKDSGLSIVGYADPRGPTTYNFGLGQQRAGSVAKYLIGAGVAETRIESSSRGETEASGTDESGWARDRKVEILLAE